LPEAQETFLLTKQFPKNRKSSFLSTAVVALVIPGLFATIALPAYAAAPAQTKAEHASAVRAEKVATSSQTVTVDASAAPTAVQHDAYQATSLAELQQAALAAAAVRARATAESSGPSVRALLDNPPNPNFSLSAVVAVAEQYEGVPYVFGGSTPAGFDCSGFTMYVYAHFGIALPHSAAAQGRMGTAIARSAAQPGDVVVMDGGAHVGIYVGPGQMIDAPEPGRTVGIHAIYDNSYYIVRFGI
jgi:cell wall-associated NlpC family hydrolase